jgi:hypothetical protein
MSINDDETKKTSHAALAVPLHPEDGKDGKKPIEAWATEKKFLPDFLPSAGTAIRRMNPEYWKFAAAKALRRWSDGDWVTEKEFDAAVGEAEGHIHR